MSLFISLISALILIPSILLTKKKWEKEKLNERSESYIKTIKENHPELAIISHEIFEEKGEKFLKITLLNDSVAISKNRLNEHNNLVKDIHLIWQYSPKQHNSETAKITEMQAQISELKLEMERIKTKKE